MRSKNRIKKIVKIFLTTRPRARQGLPEYGIINQSARGSVCQATKSATALPQSSARHRSRAIACFSLSLSLSLSYSCFPPFLLFYIYVAAGVVLYASGDRDYNYSGRLCIHVQRATGHVCDYTRRIHTRASLTTCCTSARARRQSSSCICIVYRGHADELRCILWVYMCVCSVARVVYVYIYVCVHSFGETRVPPACAFYICFAYTARPRLSIIR